MRFKLLGHSGLRVSEVALGTMTFGEEWGFGEAADECRKVFDTYSEAGGNFIDTANKYMEGSSEKMIGEFVGDERDRYVIATKYTLAMRNGDPNACGNGRKNLMRAVENSLRRLQTDYIDLLWVHAWDFVTPVEEIMRGLDDLVRSGKVLYVGVSDAPAWTVSRANTLAELRGWSRFIGLQVQYSLVERNIERELIPMADALGLGVLAWAPIAGGVLTGKYTRSKPTDSKRQNFNQSRLSERNLAIAREVDAVADELGKTSVQVALNWVRQRGSQVFPIIGARTAAQLSDSLGCLGFELEAKHLARLEQASAIELGFPHDFLASDMVQNLVFGDTNDRFDR